MVACTLLAWAGCSFQAAHVAGDGAPGGESGGDDVPPDVPRTCDFVEVAAGTDHTCARTEGGDVWCWGKDTQGQTGVPPQTMCALNCTVTPAKLAMPPVRGLAHPLGDQHACAFTQTEAYCWGANDSGQFGNNGSDAAAPLLISERANASAITAGSVHTCSVHSGGVKCSSVNNHGQVGDGTTMPRLTATANSVASASVIAAGAEHTCIITGGSVYCWGRNDGGQVTSVMSADVVIPTIVPNIAGTPIALAGGSKHTCAALTSGIVRCWGKNDNAQLGVGDTAGHPGVLQPDIGGIEELAAGDDHTCGRTAAGAVFCWGTMPTAHATPVAITLPHPAVSIAAGQDHSCAVLSDGTVWCWGGDGFGQLGDGQMTANTGLTPVQANVCH